MGASRVNRASRSGSFCNRVGQDLQRAIASQISVAGLVDLARSACADPGSDLIDADTGAEAARQMAKMMRGGSLRAGLVLENGRAASRPPSTNWRTSAASTSPSIVGVLKGA